jgi:hypothetical protein
VGIEALEKSFAYVEQQPTAIASDVLLIKRRRDIALGIEIMGHITTPLLN